MKIAEIERKWTVPVREGRQEERAQQLIISGGKKND